MRLGRKKTKTSRLWIMLTAVFWTAICGMIVFAEPLEDLYRGGRNWVRQRPADGKVVVVGLDDATFDRLGLNYSEKYDAKVIDALAAAGAKRIYFDRSYTDIYDQAGSRELVAALKRNRGKVYFGVIRNQDRFNKKSINIGPNPLYLPNVRLASLNGWGTPFSLSAELSYADEHNGLVAPSISASIANRHAGSVDRYRPDYSILASTVPTISFVDIIGGRADLGKVKGHDVIIGPNTLRLNDHHQIIGQGFVPGVYFHAIGAQTLREGSPRVVSWLVPYALALLLAAVTLFTKKRNHAVALYGFALLLSLVAPLITDSLFVRVDYLPAMLLYAIVAYRSHTFKAISTARHENSDSNLPNLAALRADNAATGKPLAALLIKNYEKILAAYPNLDVDELIGTIARPIRLTEQNAAIFHEDNTLYWPLPAIEVSQLSEHVEGLRKLLSTIVVGANSIDLDFAIGIDAHYDYPVGRRINEAKIAASVAATHGLTHSISATNKDTDEQWRLSMMSELDQAITTGAIALVYQPQLDIASNRIIGAEALVRWNHPTKGQIPPNDFIPQAEAANRIERLTYHVLALAVQDMAAIIKAHPDFKVAINVSTKMLSLSDLYQRSVEIASDHAFPLSALKLEITETAAITANPAAAQNLALFTGSGVNISIDDYGTGHATLEYLRAIPFTELKIDKQFITGLCDSNRDRLLVRSTIALAHQLGRTVTAEGIEDAKTLDVLRSLRCDRAQGFYIAKPLQIDDLSTLLNAQVPESNTVDRRTA